MLVIRFADVKWPAPLRLLRHLRRNINFSLLLLLIYNRWLYPVMNNMGHVAYYSLQRDTLAQQQQRQQQQQRVVALWRIWRDDVTARLRPNDVLGAHRAVRVLQHHLRDRLRRLTWPHPIRGGALRAERHLGGARLWRADNAQLWHRRTVPPESDVRGAQEVLPRRQHGLLRRPLRLRGVPEGHLPLRTRWDFLLNHDFF